MTAGNPLGAVQLLDFGAPKVITAYAKEIISGGELVYNNTTTEDVVSSGASSYAATDIEVVNNASGNQFLGVALKDAISGAACPVAVDGVFLLKCSGSVYASQSVGITEVERIQSLGSVATGGAEHSIEGRKIGRALVAGASGNFALVGINSF